VPTLTRRPAAATLALAVMLAGALVFATPALAADLVVAQARTQAPDWQQLTPAQRRTLATLEPRWPGMSAERRAKWVRTAERIGQLPEADQARIRQRMVEWAAMSPAERAQARQRYKEARQVPGAERKAWWEAYSRLPESERRSLAADRAERERQPEQTDKPGENRRPQGVMAAPAARQAPRIVTTPQQVDRSTLLPRRGPQAASSPQR
jgi:hypothetical protein